MKYLVTERLKLKDLYPERAKDLAKETDVNVDDLELVRKGVIADKTETDDEGVISFISMEGPDRDNEEMDPDGVVLTFFNKNKVVPYGHDYRGLPVGKSMWIKKATKNNKRGLLAKTVFLKHNFAQEVGKLYTEDVAGTGPAMKGWSIGFIPLKWVEPEEKGKPPKEGEADTRPRRKYTKWELVEYSAVMIPSCREALTEMVEKGLIKSEKLKKDIAELIEIEDDSDELELTIESTIEPLVEYVCPKCEGSCGIDDQGFYCQHCKWVEGDGPKNAIEILKRVITKPEEADDLIRIPAKGEEGKHKKHKIRWMTVSKKEGIKGIYCIDCKKIITFVFDKKAPYNWTMKRALKWMKDHGKNIERIIEGWSQTDAEIAFKDTAWLVLNQKLEDYDLERQVKAIVTKADDKKEEDKLNKERTIWLFGSISAGTAQGICRQLLQYDKLDSEKPIKLIIGSYGGEVYASFAIIDAMEYIKAPVETIGLGMVMSGGLLIFMAGDNRKISQNASVLSHRFFSINWGSQAELEADRVEDDAIHNRMIEHYIKFTRLKTKEEVLEKLLQTTNVWLTAAQAIEYEIADEFVDNDWLAQIEQNRESGDGKAIELVDEMITEIGKDTATQNKGELEQVVVKFVGSPRNPFGAHCSFRFKGGAGGYKRAWVTHFSQVNGGALTPRASGPIRGTVRRVAMIAMAMKPPCTVVESEGLGPRGGAKSPLPGTYPQRPSDYGLSSWLNPGDENVDREKALRFTCGDLNVIKRAAVAEVKRRIKDREAEEEGKGMDDEEREFFKWLDQQMGTTSDFLAAPETVDELFEKRTDGRIRLTEEVAKRAKEDFKENMDENGIGKVTQELWNSIIDQLKEPSDFTEEIAKEALLELHQIKEEIKSLKEGRVLSAKNRKLIQNILTAMEAAIPPLKSLLTATEPPKEEEFELDIDKGEGSDNEGKDVKEKPGKLEIDTEQLRAIVQGVFQNNLDKIGQMVADKIAKARGRVE